MHTKRIKDIYNDITNSNRLIQTKYNISLISLEGGESKVEKVL